MLLKIEFFFFRRQENAKIFKLEFKKTESLNIKNKIKKYFKKNRSKDF